MKWTFQTDAIIIPIELTVVVEKSIENLLRKYKIKELTIIHPFPRVVSDRYSPTKDCLTMNGRNGICTRQEFPKHMSKVTHGVPQVYDSRNSTKP